MGVWLERRGALGSWVLGLKYEWPWRPWAQWLQTQGALALAAIAQGPGLIRGGPGPMAWIRGIYEAGVYDGLLFAGVRADAQ